MRRKPKIMAPEISIKYTGGMFTEKTLTSSTDAYEFCRSLYNPDTILLRESFYVVYLNRSNQVLGWMLHAQGGINKVVVDSRLILAVALKSCSVGLLLSHNHPGGNCKPSNEDINVTSNIKEACKMFDILLLDHIIVTKDNYYSFLDSGIL